VGEGDMSANDLSAKAAVIEDYVEKYLVDPHGIIYSVINNLTGRLWNEEDLKDSDAFKLPGVSPWDLLSYENCGMTTGAYLAAMTAKYRTTGNSADLILAGRCFEGLQFIYEIGKKKEEGYFPKIYGGKYSEQISSDQYIYALKGMDLYYDIAPVEHRKQICRMVEKMVNFWMKRRYRYNYYTINDMQWPLGRFPAFLIIAYRITKEQKFLDEFKRLNREEAVYMKPADSALAKLKSRTLTEYEKQNGNRYLLGALEDCAAMEIIALESCLKYSSDFTESWKQSMREIWHEGKLALTPENLAYRQVLYDPASGHSAPIPEAKMLDDESVLDWQWFSWRGNVLTPRSTMLARAGFQIQKWVPDENAAAISLRILNDVRLDQMRHYLDPDGKQILPCHKYLTECVCADSIVNWLWAYWQGKQQNLITD
jgi:hypothetical protein